MKTLLDVDAALEGDLLRSDRCNEIRRLIATWGRRSTISRRDMKMALRMCATGQEPRPWVSRALDILIKQRFRMGFRLLYEVYQQCYWHGRLRSHLAQRASERGEDRLPLPEGAAEVVFSTDPERSIGRHAVARGLRLARIAAGYGLRESTALARATQMFVLHGASAEWYRTLGDDEIRHAVRVVLADHSTVGSFLDGVVQACSMSGWSPENVNESRFARTLFAEVASSENLGAPSEHPSRWRGVAGGTRRLVQWWLAVREVEGFFTSVDSAPARKLFWMRAARVIREFHHYPDSKTFIMKIGDWYFVEFGEGGNACYVYDEGTFAQIKERADRWGSGGTNRWKDRGKLKRIGPIYDHWGAVRHNGELRMIHNPTGRGWQSKFEFMIQYLTGESLD